MSLIYVTGLSGAGKSAVLDELVARGCEARGVDEDGYEEGYRRFGAVIVDASRPLDRVVDDVLAASRGRRQDQAGPQADVV
jgi:thymidylate kinase